MVFLLSVNAGSSSIKTTVFNVKKESIETVVKSSVSGLGSAPKFTYTNRKTSLNNGGSKNIDKQQITNIENVVDGLEHILGHLSKDNDFKAYAGKLDNLKFICHRIVHGGHIGDEGPRIIDEEDRKELDNLKPLAPLHNGPAMSLLHLCLQKLPSAQNVGLFDTTFHATMPDYVSTYPIDQEQAKKKGLRRYGFHGLSYQWTAKNVATYLRKVTILYFRGIALTISSH